MHRTIDFELAENDGEENRWQRETKRLIANNKKAYHDYFIEETYETGIVLSRNGGKVPAHGQMQHQGVLYAGLNKGEVFIYGMHISPYEKGQYFQ